MNTSLKIVLVCALCALAACSKGGSGTSASESAGTTASAAPESAGTPASSASAGSSSASGNWVANGATACEKYLTPDVVAAILTHPAGRSKTLGAQGCDYETTDSGGSISITLTAAGPAAFDAEQKYFVNPIPLPGVGDKAVRHTTGIEAIKGEDRGCSIQAGGAPGSTKLTGEALAQKLGEICNKLFALP
jgi:hypothetical protein